MMANTGLEAHVARGIVRDCSECVYCPDWLYIPILVNRPHGVMDCSVVFVV